jgi:DNA invertase Pin-like site-specific DNA recombinase
VANDLLAMLRRNLQELLLAQGVDLEITRAVVEQLVGRVQKLHGGDRLLVPKIDRERRDEAIRTASRRGMLPAEIARVHGIPLATVYGALNRQRHRRKTPSDAGFGSDEWNL